MPERGGWFFRWQYQLAFSFPAISRGINEFGVPFKAHYTTTSTTLQPPPMMVHRILGEGVASHLGESSFVSVANVNASTSPPFAVAGTRTITAANGDQLFTRFTGLGTPVVNGRNGADLQETITGGTGRFKNASGSYTVVARNDWNTSTFTADFSGYIKY